MTSIRPAVIYAAKSTTDVRGSIPDQVRDGHVVAQREGLTVFSEHEDEAKSAYKGNRGEGLEEALSECERLAQEHGSCALIVQHSDRIARGNGRDARHLTEYVLWAIKNDVQIKSVQDPDTFPEGDYALLMSAVMGQRNTEDSRRKALAVSDGLRRRVQKGKVLGGPTPYGYERRYRGEGPSPESFLALDEAQARVVRRVYEEFLAGASHREIAAGLVRDGIPAPKGGLWSQSTVKSTLKRKLYTGVIEDKDGNEIEGEHPAIIDRVTFDRAQRSSKTQARKGGRPSNGGHLLTGGLLKCGECGSTMNPRTTPRGRAYYVCSRRNDLGKEHCSQPSVDRRWVDEPLMIWLTEHALDVEETRRQVEERAALVLTSVRRAVQAADSELATADARFDRVQRDYQDRRISPEDWTAQRGQLAAEQQAAAAEAARLRARLEEVESERARADAETYTLRALVEYKGLARDLERAGAVSLDAVRTTLKQTFAAVIYQSVFDGRYTDETVFGGVPTGAGGMLSGIGSAHGLLTPLLEENAIIGETEDGCPIIRRSAVPLADLIERPSAQLSRTS